MLKTFPKNLTDAQKLPRKIKLKKFYPKMICPRQQVFNTVHGGLLKLEGPRSTLATTFYVVNATFEMGCMITMLLFTRDDRKNDKNTSLSSSANGN